MKELIKKLFRIEPEVQYVEVEVIKEVEVPVEVIKEIPIAKVGEMLDVFQDKLSNRSTVLQLCSEGVTEYQRGRIQGQIDMLSKIMLELAGSDDAKKG